MGAGDDTFVWNPGDGSDTVEGQDGNDTMQFNGANVNDFLPGRDTGEGQGSGSQVAACAVSIGALYIGIGRPVEVLAQTRDGSR